MLVVHPNNPTGSFVKPHEAEELNRICAANDMAIIADEVFLDYSLAEGSAAHVFVEQHSADLHTERVVEDFRPAADEGRMDCGERSAAAAGGCAGRLEVIADTYLSMNAPVQWAVPAMLEERHGIQRQLLQRIDANLAVLDSQLASQKLCRRLEVEGGWYAVLRVPVAGSDEELAIALLRETGVLVQPGHFYDFASDGYLVVSLITPRRGVRRGNPALAGICCWTSFVRHCCARENPDFPEAESASRSASVRDAMTCTSALVVSGRRIPAKHPPILERRDVIITKPCSSTPSSSHFTTKKRT